MRRLSLLLLLSASACTTYFGEPNPTIVDDELCEQHGGTCGGSFFGGCPVEGNWRVDDSLKCSGFEVSCCFPTDAGPDVETVDAQEAGVPEAGVDGTYPDAFGEAETDGGAADSGRDADPGQSEQ